MSEGQCLPLITNRRVLEGLKKNVTGGAFVLGLLFARQTALHGASRGGLPSQEPGLPAEGMWGTATWQGCAVTRR